MLKQIRFHRHPPRYTVGQQVVLTLGKETKPAKVLDMVNNAVLFEFDGDLSGYMERMPVVWRDGAWRDLMHGEVVQVKASYDD